MWTLGTGANTAKNHAICDGPTIIATVLGNGYPTGKGWSPESAETARLIAAAPEMLEALKLMQAALSEYRLRDVRKYYSLCIADAAANAAIEKAKGEDHANP